MSPKKVLITIPETLHSLIRDEARKECRSIHNYIVYILSKHLKHVPEAPKRKSDDPVDTDEIAKLFDE